MGAWRRLRPCGSGGRRFACAHRGGRSGRRERVRAVAAADRSVGPDAAGTARPPCSALTTRRRDRGHRVARTRALLPAEPQDRGLRRSGPSLARSGSLDRGLARTRSRGGAVRADRSARGALPRTADRRLRPRLRHAAARRAHARVPPRSAARGRVRACGPALREPGAPEPRRHARRHLRARLREARGRAHGRAGTRSLSGLDEGARAESGRAEGGRAVEWSRNGRRKVFAYLRPHALHAADRQRLRALITRCLDEAGPERVARTAPGLIAKAARRA